MFKKPKIDLNFYEDENKEEVGRRLEEGMLNIIDGWMTFTVVL